jgi:hypothetical protein
MKSKLTRVVREPGFWAVGVTVLPVVWYSAIGGSFLLVSPTLTLMVVGFWLVVVALSGLVWLALARPPWFLSATERRNFRLRRAGAVALWAGVLLSVPLTRWPVRLSFAISQPALDAVADQVERGETLRYPVRAGLFVIRKAEMNDLGSAGLLPAQPCLWVEDYGASLGRAALARGPREDGHYSQFSVSRLSGNWSQVDED